MRLLPVLLCLTLCASARAADADPIEIFTLKDGRVLKGRYHDGVIETIGGRNVIQVELSDISERKPADPPAEPAEKSKPTTDMKAAKSGETKETKKPADAKAVPRP
jgi:hypothetical protein